MAEDFWEQGKTADQEVTLDVKGKKYIKCITMVKPAAPPPPDPDDCICKGKGPAKVCTDITTGKKCKPPKSAKDKDPKASTKIESNSNATTNGTKAGNASKNGTKAANKKMGNATKITTKVKTANKT